MFTYEIFATFAVESEKRTLGHLENRRIGYLSTWRIGDKWTRRNGDSENRILVHSEKWRIGETETSGHGETDTWRIGDITGGTRYMFNKNRNIYDLRRRAGIEFPQSTWT